MKRKTIKRRLILALAWFAVVVLPLAFVSCSEKGGTLEIRNQTGSRIYAFSASDLSELNREADKVAFNLSEMNVNTEAGGSYTESYDEDGTVFWFWAVEGGTLADLKTGSTLLEKGETQTVNAR